MEQINTSLPFSGYIDSRQGGRKENQDSCGFIDTPLGLLITVCDGMGGGPGGKLAATLAVETILQTVRKAKETDDPVWMLEKAIRTANTLIYQKGLETASLKGMGSTVTALLVSKQSAIVAHVGDSRIYQFRRGGKIFRTFDHSMVFDLVKQKVITEEQARLSAQSNLITRALGVKAEVDVELQELAYEKGDRFLLCTDGISGAIPEKELVKIVAKTASLSSAVDNIIVQVDELGFRNGGGHDNLTAALIETKFNSILKEKMSTRVRNILLVLTAVCCISVAVNIFLLLKPAAPGGSRPATGEVDINAVLKAERDKVRQEMNEMQQKFKKSLDSISDLLNKQEIDAAKSYIKDESNKRAILSKLDKVIEQLERLGAMKKGKSKNSYLTEVTQSLKDLIGPLEKEYGIGKEQFSDKNNGIIGYLSQSIAKDDDDKSKGHYNAIIKKMKEIKLKVSQSD